MKKLKWKCHTKALLEEIIECAQIPVFDKPIRILYMLLQEVSNRCIELNDDKLNELMIRLTLYTVSDPYYIDYDEKIVNKYLKGE